MEFFKEKCFGIIKRCILSLCVAAIALCISVPFSASADTSKTIKVGYVELQNFLFRDKSGNFTGLAYEILNEIGIYNNWDYEFKQVCYSESEKMLNDGTIDIFIPYQKTPERMKKYEYSNNVFCQNKASLLTSPEKDIYYNDFDAMKNITIGASKATRNDERFVKLLNSKGCNVKVKDNFNNQSELVKAMNDGDIDAFVSASNRGISDCKIISVLPATNSYVIAKKGNRSVLDKVDYALSQIELNMPNFKNIVDEKYQISQEGAYPSLTREEANYIKSKGKVGVLVVPSECDEDGNFSESSKKIFDKISEMTGLAFKPVISNNSATVLNDFSNGKSDIVYQFNRDYEWAKMHNAWITDKYAEFYDKIISKKTTENIKTVALVKNSFIEYNIKRKFDYKCKYYESYVDCIEAVYNGEVDATYCNSPIGNYYSTFPKFSSLSFVSAYDSYSAYCMAVSKFSDIELVSIINKSLSCIPNESMLSDFEAQVASRPVSIIDSFYSHPLLWIALTCVVVAILAIIVFMMCYVVIVRRKNSQLAIANNAKTDFLSRMSHDMRTPMNVILGLSEMMSNETDINEIYDDISQIQLSGKYLLDLINDTLDMSRIESGKLELHIKPIDSRDLFSNVITNATTLANEKGVVLDLKTPDIPDDKWIAVKADSSRVEQVLINIISNAIKFTEPGGTVQLKMETVLIDEEKVIDKYIITDNGIGMSEEFLPHLFESFSQEGRTNTSRGEGTGLGMPIVKNIVDLMGGTIDVKSKLNEGTTVTIILPYERSYETKVEQTEDYDLSVLEGKNILVCEDHPLNAKITERLLANKKMTCDIAVNGKQGAQMYNSSKFHYYDLILMDIRMPIMNGIESAKLIRSLERADAKRIPIIAMTANAFEDDVKNCLNAGMNDHLSKPIDSTKFYQTLAKYLSENKKRK